MNALTFIPRDEFDAEYSQMRDEAKKELFPLMTAIHALLSVKRGIGAEIKRWASKLDCSEGHLRRQLDNYRKNPSWKTLVNKSKAGREWWDAEDLDGCKSKVEFVSWLKSKVDSNQRGKFDTQYRAVIRQWKDWKRGDLTKKIPGYDSPPLPAPGKEHPAGWSNRNLRRLAKRDRFEKTAIRIGLGAALSYGPQALTSRAGLYLMSHVMIDDLWHDNFTVFRGKPVRVLEFDGLDVFSGYKAMWGTKPRFQRDDGMFDNLKESFVAMLLAGLFFREGYAPRGTCILAELGTAAVSERIQRLLYDASGGKITVRENGITGEEQALVGRRGKGKGNPRFKASLESLRNLIHNELAALPGQTGLNVKNRPEWLVGELEETNDLLKAVQVIAQRDPERAALIRLPLLEYHSQFLPLLAEVYHRINDRDWHSLQGWSDLGHVVTEYRLSPDSDKFLGPSEFLALPPATQTMLTNIVQQDERYFRVRKLSPLDVWRKHRAGLERLPASAVGEILGQSFAVERNCADCYFEFEDSDLHSESLVYEGRIKTPAGNEIELKSDKYLTLVNPFDLSVMFVYDAAYRYLGFARRVMRPSRADDEAVKRQLGRQKERLADRLAPLKRDHREMVKQAAADARHNANLLPAPPREEAEPVFEDCSEDL